MRPLPLAQFPGGKRPVGYHFFHGYPGTAQNPAGEGTQGGQENAAPVSSDAGGGIAGQIWGNPFLWAGIAAVLVALWY